MHTETVTFKDLAMNVQRQVATGIQDLSKGFVPIVLVLALLAPAYFVGRKIEGIAREQSAMTQSIREVQTKLDTVTPIVHEVAVIRAMVDSNARSLELMEREKRLLEVRIKDLEIEAGVRQRTEGR